MTLFITATGTDVGKTYVTLKLLKELAKKGYRVGVLKPIETGVEKTPLDGSKLYKAVKKLNPTLAEKISLKDVVPITMKLPAAPFVAQKGPIDYKKIEKAYKKISKYSDIVLIEGAGGAFVPLDRKRDMTYFIKKYGCKTILVTRDSLGTISDTIAYKKALKTEGIKSTLFVNIRDKKEYIEKTEPFFSYKYDKIFYETKRLAECIKEI